MAIDSALVQAMMAGSARQERKKARDAETLAALASLAGTAVGAGVGAGFGARGAQIDPDTNKQRRPRAVGGGVGAMTGAGVGGAIGQSLGGLAAGSYGTPHALRGAQAIPGAFNPMIQERQADRKMAQAGGSRNQQLKQGIDGKWYLFNPGTGVVTHQEDMTFGLKEREKPAHLSEIQEIKTEGDKKRVEQKQQALKETVGDIESEKAKGKYKGQREASYGERKRKAETSLKMATDSHDIIEEASTAAINMIDKDEGTGMDAATAEEWMMNNAAALALHIDTIASRMTMQEIRQLKEGGAAMGVLTDADIKLIQEGIGPMSQYHPKLLRGTLVRIQHSVASSLKLKKRHFDEEFPAKGKKTGTAIEDKYK